MYGCLTSISAELVASQMLHGLPGLLSWRQAGYQRPSQSIRKQSSDVIRTKHVVTSMTDSLGTSLSYG